MKNLLLLLVSLFMLLPLSTVAQSTSKKKQGTISGTVISGSDKEPLAAASIQLFSMPDTVYKVGAPTDLDGKFSVDIEAGNYLLRVSYVGFVTRDI